MELILDRSRFNLTSWIKWILLICLCFHSNFTLAAPVCSPDVLKKKLQRMDLSPDIKINSQLSHAIKLNYGLPFYQTLIEVHPYLEEAQNAQIDTETLEWIKTYIRSTDHDRVQYVALFLKSPHYSEMTAMATGLLEMLEQHGVRTKLVFPRESSARKFFEFTKKNLKSIILERLPGISNEKLKTFQRTFTETYSGSYHIGFQNINNPSPLVVIDGHSSEGQDGITLGDFNITSEGIVKRLKAMGLEMTSRIDLLVCDSGLSHPSPNLTVNEIKEKFFSKELESAVGGGDASFIAIFSAEIHKQIPDFKGEVYGYLGQVLMPYAFNVLMPDGEIQDLAQGVLLRGSDGNLIINRPDAKYIRRSAPK